MPDGRIFPIDEQAPALPALLSGQQTLPWRVGRRILDTVECSTCRFREEAPMNCPNCETAGSPGDTYCAACGARLAAARPQPGPERELCSFGPMGISISHARPGLFAWSTRNLTRVVLTDRRLYGIRQPPLVLRILGGGGQRALFDIPLASIVSIERADFAANRACWIEYRSGRERKGVSITARVLCHEPLRRCEEILRSLCTSAAGTTRP
jgi:hypothetical protein